MTREYELTDKEYRIIIDALQYTADNPITSDTRTKCENVRETLTSQFHVQGEEMSSDNITQEQEFEDIQSVQRYIRGNSPVTMDEIISANPGPTTNEELSREGLTQTQQIRRIVKGLDRCGCVNHATDAYIEWVGH